MANASNSQSSRQPLQVVAVITHQEPPRFLPPRTDADHRRRWWLLMYQQDINQKILDEALAQAQWLDEQALAHFIAEHRELQTRITTLRRDYCALYGYHPEEYDADDCPRKEGGSHEWSADP